MAMLLAGLAVLLQWLGQAYTSNFGSEEPDEPAHYVTGLMIRDYVTSGFHQSPLPYAKNYYLHYPKVALGAWPPFFYVVEAIWMLLFSPARQSVLLLSALITVSSALTLFLVIQRRLGAALGVFVAAAFIVLPTVQISTASVMIDGLVALLEILAAVQFARYLDGQNSRAAYAFAGMAALAALTKANALALVLVPVFAVALTGKWRLLRRKEIWLGMLLIGLAAAPWNLFLLRLAVHSVSLVRTDPLFALNRGWSYLRLLAEVTGLFLPVAVAGAWVTIVRPFRQELVTGLWAAALALIAAGFVFHAAVPANVIEPRYLLPSIAPVLMFAAAGLDWIGRLGPAKAVTARVPVAAATLALLFMVFQFHLPRREQTGFAPVARRLAHKATPQAILVSANSSGEGMAVSEIAMEDVRPRHYVLRSTKVLSGSDWNGEGYRSRFATASQVSDYLETVPVDCVLLAAAHTNETRLLHHRLLSEALQSHPERWSLDRTSAGPFSVWERIHPVDHREPNFSVDMNYTFNGSISTEHSSK